MSVFLLGLLAAPAVTEPQPTVEPNITETETFNTTYAQTLFNLSGLSVTNSTIFAPVSLVESSILPCRSCCCFVASWRIKAIAYVRKDASLLGLSDFHRVLRVPHIMLAVASCIHGVDISCVIYMV